MPAVYPQFTKNIHIYLHIYMYLKFSSRHSNTFRVERPICSAYTFEFLTFVFYLPPHPEFEPSLFRLTRRNRDPRPTFLFRLADDRYPTSPKTCTLLTFYVCVCFTYSPTCSSPHIRGLDDLAPRVRDFIASTCASCLAIHPLLCTR